MDTDTREMLKKINMDKIQGLVNEDVKGRKK